MRGASFPEMTASGTPDVGALLGGADCFLIDLDGTLLDSAPAHAAAFREAIETFAKPRAADFDYASVAGRSTRAVCLSLCEGDAARAERMTDHKQRAYRAALERGDVALFEHARALLDAITSAGRRAILVTSASPESAHAALAVHGLEAVFADVVHSGLVENAKPAPDLFLLALERSALYPADCLTIEDADSGLAASRAAGVAAVRVHAPAAEPSEVAFDDLGELLAAFRDAMGEGDV